jgi:competence protein ComEA
MKLFRVLCAVLIAFCMVGVGTANAASNQPAKTQAVATQSVDINSADVQTLEGLKGVGEKKAQAIVSYRTKNGEFKSVDNLTAVKGISDKFLAKLKQNNPGMIVANHTL